VTLHDKVELRRLLFRSTTPLSVRPSWNIRGKCGRVTAARPARRGRGAVVITTGGYESQTPIASMQAGGQKRISSGSEATMHGDSRDYLTKIFVPLYRRRRPNGTGLGPDWSVAGQQNRRSNHGGTMGARKQCKGRRPNLVGYRLRTRMNTR